MSRTLLLSLSLSLSFSLSLSLSFSLSLPLSLCYLYFFVYCLLFHCHFFRAILIFSLFISSYVYFLLPPFSFFLRLSICLSFFLSVSIILPLPLYLVPIPLAVCDSFFHSVFLSTFSSMACFAQSKIVVLLHHLSYNTGVFFIHLLSVSFACSLLALYGSVLLFICDLSLK